MKSMDSRPEKATDATASPADQQTQFHIVCHDCANEGLVKLHITAWRNVAAHRDDTDHDVEMLEVHTA